MIKLLKTIKINDKNNFGLYKFYLKSVSFKNSNNIYINDLYISCLTPENAFGYKDSIILNKQTFNINNCDFIYNNTGFSAYGLERCFPKWILKKVGKQLLKLSIKYDVFFELENEKILAFKDFGIQFWLDFIYTFDKRTATTKKICLKFGFKNKLDVKIALFKYLNYDGYIC